MNIEPLGKTRCFGGEQLRYRHDSEVNNCPMTFSLYLPESAQKEEPVPVIFWLSGLTCSDENFVQKAGAQQFANKYKLAIVCPDTSPRGEGVADDAQGSYDFGLGAGFYLDASEEPWNKHYKMYSYVSAELPFLLAEHFPQLQGNIAIMGHSMGGHGALTIALKNPQKFRSVSAFAPISSPLHCPWGQKAFAHYLGGDRETWRQYDACELINLNKSKIPLLVEQGSADDFLQQQLKPELLQLACKENNHPLTFNLRDGYDHSYYFISSFIEGHIQYHAKHLRP